MSATTFSEGKPHTAQPSYNTIVRRIGARLREVYEHPEADPLPNEHVDLLLRLRHKERERTRSRG
jgi:hypothetical protein